MRQRDRITFAFIQPFEEDVQPLVVGTYHVNEYVARAVRPNGHIFRRCQSPSSATQERRDGSRDISYDLSYRGSLFIGGV